MPEQRVPPVEPKSVGAQKPPHARDQIPFGRLDHPVKIITQQGQGVNLPIRLGARFAEGCHEPLPVGVIVEAGFAPVPAIHLLVDRAFVFNPQRSRQDAALPKSSIGVNSEGRPLTR